MESTLDSILSEEGQPEEVIEAQPETAAVETAPEPTGEVAAPPAVQEDPIDTHRKGLEAAVIAERRKRQELEQQLQQFRQQQTQPKAEDGPPDASQYEGNPQEYWAKLARYEARQEIAQAVRQANEQQAEAARLREKTELDDQVNAVVAAGNAKYRDFDAVINNGLGPFLNPTLRESLTGEHGHEVAYWLGKNPAEAARVSALPPLQMAREIGRIESRVTAPKPQAIPQTLTQSRDSRGQFQPAFDGPTPLDAILNGRT